MNTDAQLIKAALNRSFSRVAIPPCPDDAWRAPAIEPAPLVRPRASSRRFAYAATALAVVAVAGLTAQASDTIKQGYTHFMVPFFVSSRPLMPGIHRADRLTIAQAQRRMNFPIVVPRGLPERTRFLYAHVISEQPIPRVALSYEAHIANKYYRISLNESTVAVGSPVAHFEFRSLGHGSKKWSFPMRRWKRGNVVMDLSTWGLPPEVTENIVRANTQESVAP